MNTADFIAQLRSYDSETHRFREGLRAPPIVCGSTARVVDGKIVGELLPVRDAARAAFRAFLEAGYTLTLANAAYDCAVLAQEDPSLLPLIFQALRDGKIYDILIGESLNAIYGGHLGETEDGRNLVNPATGKVTKRYSLALVTLLTLGRTDAKENDAWQSSYALLEDIPVENWPADARQYPVDDAKNTLEPTIVQIFGRPGDHAWHDIPPIPGIARGGTFCKHCHGELGTVSTVACPSAPRGEPHKNIENHAAQVEAAFALWLGACWALRTDGERVEKLSIEVEAKHKKAVERFQKKGWIRDDGTEDQNAVKKAVAEAYGATGACPRCEGTGKVRRVTWVPCRGAKVKGRYRGHQGIACETCNGDEQVQKIGNEVTCKNVFDERGVLVEDGCDGTGLDLTTAPMMPRSDKLGVKTDRDTVMESGDEDLADFGENEFEKSRSTYVPYLRTGIDRPLSYSPNILVASGRCSYEGSPLHQMPRAGGERECIRARGAWCGSPIEYVIGSTDYEAGELCTLAQFCYWVLGHSRMRETINETGKPGILHSDLAAQTLGISLDEFLVRLKAKDKQCVDFRQASKPISFGKPGLMGSAKLVWTSRKKGAGFTECEQGPAIMTDSKGVTKRGYWGVRFCILVGGRKQCGTQKIMQWKKRACPPVCKACVEIVENVLTAAYFKRYPEIKAYFEWVFNCLDSEGGRVPCLVWDEDTGKPKVVRWRGGADKAAACNNGFQAMLADVGKLAVVNITRECYLGIKPDGSSSPLTGSRLPLFAHDEPITELIRDRAHDAGPRVAEIMMAAGNKLAPDVTWRAETAIAEYLSKSMEPCYDSMGNLILWAPPIKAAA